MKKRYRIVTDGCFGYKVQHRPWFWPFWTDGGFNSHLSVSAAEAWLRRRLTLGTVVKYLGEL